MDIRRSLAALAALGMAVALPSCRDNTVDEVDPDILATDPLVARALSDPLMVDPDLAYRNEANAAVTVRYDHPLPPLAATDELAARASDVARIQLLDGGPTSDLPRPVNDAVPDLSGPMDARTMVGLVGGPAECSVRLEDGLGWAARMPGPSAIMPHGMVQQAAGVESGACSLRVVRYLTPAAIDDVMQFHFTLADRARLSPTVFENPERAILGDGREAQLAVQVRPGPGGLAAVDLIYWRK